LFPGYPLDGDEKYGGGAAFYLGFDLGGILQAYPRGGLGEAFIQF